MEKIVIDGYNLLHQVKEYKSKLELDLENARDQLVHDLIIYRSNKKIEIMIVFDGITGISDPYYHRNVSGIKIIFSRAPRTADSIIMEIIKSEKRKKRITVVTNDREIISFANSLGARYLSPKAFYQRLKTHSKAPQSQNKFEYEMTAEELEEWMKIFGIK